MIRMGPWFMVLSRVVFVVLLVVAAGLVACGYVRVLKGTCLKSHYTEQGYWWGNEGRITRSATEVCDAWESKDDKQEDGK